MILHIIRYAFPVMALILSVFALLSVVDMRMEMNTQHRAIYTLQEIEMKRQREQLTERLYNARSDSIMIMESSSKLRRIR